MGQSRSEDILENILGAENPLGDPKSREEQLLMAILNGDKEPPFDEPQSREESLLMQIIEKGVGGAEYLIDKSELIANTYIGTNGTAVSSQYFKATPYIEVVGGDVYKVANPQNGNGLNAWYKADKTFISQIMLQNVGYLTITAPANAKYARFSGGESNMLNLMVWHDT